MPSLSKVGSEMLDGALPAISGASLTHLDAIDLENALPAISGASLTGITTGKILQVVSNQMTATTGGTSQNTFVDSGLNGTITPTASTSRIMVMVFFTLYWVNNSGDGGYSVRMKQAISGGATTYPERISSGDEGSSNHHGFLYQGAPFSTSSWYHPCTFFGIAPDTGTIGTTSAITYTLQYSTYNLDGAGIGGIGGKQTVTMIEIGA